MLLDKLRPTSPGLDGIPHWFLRVAAPFICQPLAYLCNQSLSQCYIPRQWKSSVITPVPKINQPQSCADYRPISVTSLLCRVLEKIIIQKYFYPILAHPSCDYLFQDQFAFRPTGSTTAALINLLHKITTVLQDNNYVHLISLDFSKAFDSVRHSKLNEKIAKLPIPDFAHNWTVEYLSQRQHCTKFNSIVSLMLQINASIVQGSRIGPMAYVIDASDLHPVTPGNMFSKYADDTHLLVPPRNSNTIQSELDHIAEWSENNNLKLNTSKTVEMIIHKPRFNVIDFPSPLPGILRLNQAKFLGVIITDTLSFDEHVNTVVTRVSQVGYALRILRAHGLCGQALWDLARSTAISRLTYASPAWYGYLNKNSLNKIQGVINRFKRYGYLPADQEDFSVICETADNRLFNTVLNNRNHVLHQLLPPVKLTPYDLRTRSHNHSLPRVDNNLRKNFIYRLLYKNIY